MRGPLACAAALLMAASPASADLSFLQVVQAQTSHGREGVFGKTWVEISGSKMRLVSGYASKLQDGVEPEEPRRIIQIIDLAKKTRTLVFPESKSYTLAPLSEVAYDDRLTGSVSRGGPSKRLQIEDTVLTRQGHTRTLMGAVCEHWRLRMRLAAVAIDGTRRQARMDMDLWVAPVSGPLMDTLLDLIAFENAYREASGGQMSPLDYERYQLREAAAFLQIPAVDLKEVAVRARLRMRELPSYPLGISVSWSSPEEERRRDPPPAIRPSPAARPPRSRDDDPVEALRRTLRSGGLKSSQVPSYARPAGRQRYKAIDWRRSERSINRMYLQTRRNFGSSFPLGPMPASRPQARIRRGAEQVYPEFGRGMQEILDELLTPVEVESPEPSVPVSPAQPAPPDPKGPLKPFYEVYTELHGLEASTEVPQDDFALPAGYRKADERVGSGG